MVYEIFDGGLSPSKSPLEVLDYGYPQNCAIDLMKQLIRLGKASNEVEEDASTITSQVTGAIDW